RADIFYASSAADGLLHSIANIVLPEQPVRELTFLFPKTVIRDQIGQQIRQEGGVVINQKAVVNRIRKPTAELMKMRLWFTIVAAQPETNVVVEVMFIPQPAAFRDVK